ncbi:MAG: hypothetical protein SFV23_24770 [Planctomycetaceae bacterium]|nr:hypothetical protein [Planctomycetaceae bacterium]
MNREMGRTFALLASVIGIFAATVSGSHWLVSKVFGAGLSTGAETALVLSGGMILPTAIFGAAFALWEWRKLSELSAQLAETKRLHTMDQSRVRELEQMVNDQQRMFHQLRSLEGYSVMKLTLNILEKCELDLGLIRTEILGEKTPRKASAACSHQRIILQFAKTCKAHLQADREFLRSTENTGRTDCIRLFETAKESVINLTEEAATVLQVPSQAPAKDVQAALERASKLIQHGLAEIRAAKGTLSQMA